MFGKKTVKILKLPPVRNCFTLAMTNKLVVIINRVVRLQRVKVVTFQVSLRKGIYWRDEDLLVFWKNSASFESVTVSNVDQGRHLNSLTCIWKSSIPVLQTPLQYSNKAHMTCLLRNNYTISLACDGVTWLLCTDNHRVKTRWFRAVFLNRRALASIIPGRERSSWNLSF